jgi:hypothetical protein
MSFISRIGIVSLAWAGIFASFCLEAQAPAAPSQTLSEVNGRIASSVRSGAASGPSLRAALATRRDLLKEVLRNDPAGARSYALEEATRSAILAADPSAAALLEQNSAITGELAVSVADDFQHGAASTHYALHTFTRDLDLSLTKPIPGIEHMLHQSVTAHGISLDSIMAVDSLARATPAEAAACASARTTASSALASQADAAPATCSATGTQRIAVLLVTFPGNTPAFPTGLDQAAYWNKVLFGANPSVNGFWNEVSYGQTSASGDVFGPFALSQAYDCNSTTDMQTAAIAAAAGTVDFTQYNRYVIVFPVNSCYFGGLATIGCQSSTATINHQYSVVWLPISSWYGTDDVNPQMWGAASHELGHNLGLNHANTLDFGSVTLGPLDFIATNPGTVHSAPPPLENTTSVGASGQISGVNTEYGDPFSVMGYPWNDAGPYSAEHRVNLLGWIPKTDQADITASGTYTLVPAENSSGLRALHVLRDPISDSWLWLEFHQPTGFYTPDNIVGNPGSLTSGALIHYESSSLDSLHTYLLDMTPVAVSNNFNDGTLAPGNSWSDPYSLLTLTAGAQTSSSLGITVSYDTPCATLSLSASELSFAGGTANLTITAPSTCSWNVSSNASWISFPGTTSGSGNALIPFTYAANPTTAQQNSYITAQRQSLPVVQDGPNVTIVGVSPTMGAGSGQSFVVTASDSAGISDIFDVPFLVGNCEVDAYMNLSGSNPPAFYLFDSSQGGSSASLLPGSNSSLSVDVCTLYGQGSSVVFNGNQVQMTVNLGFPSTFRGIHPLTAEAFTGINGNSNSVGPFQLGIFTANPPTTQTIMFPAIAPGQIAATQIALSATSTSGLAVSFSSATPTVCTVAGTTASLLISGTCTIQATQAGSGSYAAAPMVSQSFTVSKATQTITLSPITGTHYALASVPLTATASSGLTVGLASTTPAVCSVSGTTASLLTAGTCVIHATQTGNAAYFAAPLVSQSFTVAKAPQTIAFPVITGVWYALSQINLSATASSGLTVSFATTTPTVCSLAGNTASLLIAGSCILQVSQTGSTVYTAALPVTQVVAVHLAHQSITVTPVTTTQYALSQLTLSASSSSGLTVTLSSVTPTVCTLSGNTASFLIAGTCDIHATQAGNPTYAVAPLIAYDIDVHPIIQTITFPAITGPNYPLTKITLSATATSGLAVSFASITPAICTVSGKTASLLATGNCYLHALQTGNPDYAAAPIVTQQVVVTPLSQTITFPAIASQIVGANVTLSATATSGLTVAFASATGTVCTVSGTSASMLTAGACVIHATQSGNSTYSAAPLVAQSITVKAN